MAWTLLLWPAVALAPAQDRAGAPDGGAAELVRTLDEGTAKEREVALERLLEGDGAARSAALGTEPPTSPAGRRAFARFAARAGRPESIDVLLRALGDLDALVRREGAGGLGRLELGAQRLEERVAALAAATADRDGTVRVAAIRALRSIEDAGAARALAAVVERGGPERAEAAKALAELGLGAQEVARLVEGEVLAATPSSRVAIDDGEVLATLVPAYGRALGRGASTPARGARTLASLGLHPAQEVREAADAGLDGALAEWDRLERRDEAAAFLDALWRAGWSADGLDQAVARRALDEDGDPLRAIAAGDRLVQRHAATTGISGARAVAAGLTYRGAALLALGRADDARPAFERAEHVLAGALESRPDLGPRGRTAAPGGGDDAVDLLLRLASVRVFLVGVHVAQGESPFDPRVLELARRAHVASIRAQVAAYSTDSESFAGNWEAVLGRSLAPRTLLAPSATGDAAKRRLQLLGDAYTALAAVSPTELPGFLGARSDAPPEGIDARLVDPLADPERLELLKQLRIADLDRVTRRASKLEEARNRPLWAVVQRNLLEAISKDEKEGFVPLLDYRPPATTALTHAADLRAIGAPEEALAHALAARTDAAGAPNEATGSAGAWYGARVALAVGGAAVDLARPELARKELEDAEGRLVALENEIETSIDELAGGRRGPLAVSVSDPRERARLQSELERTRGLRAQVLVSLAVNANVREKDIDGARAYFDRAYELDTSDFMRVLRACYAARAGDDGEARFVLASVTPAPELEYNFACTYALLGERDAALAHLERALESQPTSGARKRQAEWAGDDPDLEGLKGDEAFEALLDRYRTGG